MVAEKQPDDWRLEQYVGALNEKLAELKRMNTCQPSQDTLAEYSRKVEFLKGVVEAEKVTNKSEKALTNQMLSAGSPSNVNSKMVQQHKARYVQELRQELLGEKEQQSQGSNLRLRKSSGSNVPQEDFDAVLRYHNSMQEKVAAEMMSLVQNLKQNSLLAGHIIRKDTENMERSSVVADQRYDQLKKESERLEVHANRSCNWCVWLMLGLVCLVFMWMIVFMRMFPKK